MFEIRWARALAFALIASVAAGAATVQAEEAYPSRAVRMVVPYSAGGITDIYARAVAQRLAEVWSQPVIVENRAGASEILGASTVAKAKPDGYTLFFGTDPSLTLNPLLYSHLPYQVSDFTPIVRVNEGIGVMVVRADLPVKSLADFINYAKAHSGAVSYGSPGAGTMQHLRMNWLASQNGFSFIHVPYSGTAPAVQAVLAGTVDTTVAPVTLVQQQIKTGKLKAVAIIGHTRFSGLPDVPSVAELGMPDLDMNIFMIVAAPAKTPRPIVDKIAHDVTAIVKEKAFEEKLTLRDGYITTDDTPEAFQKYIAEIVPKQRQRVTSANAKLD
ncbi:MAG TPA: tripartite tricarboxylate transporter substrate binding protein [Burkholderiaceae bacterium]|jgi:tripartite-type tricarboxylate transporter receptor subunit TctC